jgi:hypothetical protein
MAGKSDLLEVIKALGPCGSRADFLDSGNEQTNEDRNDGDHY